MLFWLLEKGLALSLLKKVINVALIAISSVSMTAHAGLIDLGSAQRFTFAVGGSNSALELGSEALIHGSVATTGLLQTAHGVNITGDACYGSLKMDGPTTIGNDVGSCAELSSLGSDILSASNKAKDLGLSIDAIDLGFVNISRALRAGIYNIDSLLLGGGSYLDINAAANEEVIVNIKNSALVASGAGIRLSGGITSENVIFNFHNAVESVFNFGGADVSGTFLGTNTSYIMGDGATLNDVRFYTNHFLQANVQTVKTKTTVEVPEPSTILIFFGGLFILLMRSNSKHN